MVTYIFQPPQLFKTGIVVINISFHKVGSMDYWLLQNIVCSWSHYYKRASVEHINLKWQHKGTFQNTHLGSAYNKYKVVVGYSFHFEYLLHGSHNTSQTCKIKKSHSVIAHNVTTSEAELYSI